MVQNLIKPRLYYFSGLENDEDLVALDEDIEELKSQNEKLESEMTKIRNHISSMEEQLQKQEKENQTVSLKKLVSNSFILGIVRGTHT